MLLDLISIIIAAIFLFILADLTLKKTIELAEHWGWTGTFIGMTILSIGTSLPEIMTNLIASVQILKSPENMNTLSSLVVGTNIGSDIFQQNFIIPLVAILGIILVKKKELLPNMGGLIFAATLVWIMSIGGVLSRWEGAILLGAYIAYIIYLKKDQRNHKKTKAKNHLKNRQIWGFSFMIIVAFSIMAFLANFILNHSKTIIEQLSISASFFGIIVLGIAAALPELSTALLAIYKGRKSISAGVLIGSNITNPLFALGLGATISSYRIPNVVIVFDLPVKILSGLLLFYFLWKHEALDKWKAIILTVLYVAFLIIRGIYFPIDVMG